MGHMEGVRTEGERKRRRGRDGKEMKKGIVEVERRGGGVELVEMVGEGGGGRGIVEVEEEEKESACALHYRV